MSITKVRSLSALLLVMGICSGLWQTLHAQSAGKPTGTYTNMSYHKTSGDVTGQELKIVPVQGGEYQGALQFAEGEPEDLVVVEIKLLGKKINFSVPDTDVHAGEFSGTLEVGVIRGQFRFKKGGTANVTLKKGKSYWD